MRIASGEKVGIVGRTGSGKSTLALAILRMVPTTGSVLIDGRKTEDINLSALRSNVTIIPQDPVGKKQQDHLTSLDPAVRKSSLQSGK